MFLADYHVHSSCSFDAKDRMVDMAKSELSKGITEICFTDHVDFGDQQTMQIGPDRFQLPKSQVKQFIEAMEKAPEGKTSKLGLNSARATTTRRAPSAFTPCLSMTSYSALSTT